jgi:hypothetical protein
MRHRSNWLTVLVSILVTAVFIVGVAAPAALAKNEKPPTKTSLPNGQPFKLIQQMIDGLDARIDALEAAAPQPGTMWINPLDFVSTTGSVFLGPGFAATPGLVVSAAGLADDALQAGAQVPLGFGVTGVTVCYVAGALGGFVNTVALTQNDIVPPFSSTSLVSTSLAAPLPGAESCVQTTALVTPADPSTGGPLYVAVGVSFSVADGLRIVGIGLQLSPLP